MNRFQPITKFLSPHFALALLLFSADAIARTPAPIPAAGELEKNFARPPASARPWVYWFWLNSNVTPEGITADLEAMRRVGIGGVLLMDVDQGVLAGSVKFMDDAWRELFAHAVREAKRLGMEINANNGPGYFGSGGAWMSPEMGMQTVLTSETRVQGGRPWTGVLPHAERQGGRKTTRLPRCRRDRRGRAGSGDRQALRDPRVPFQGPDVDGLGRLSAEARAHRWPRPRPRVWRFRRTRSWT